MAPTLATLLTRRAVHRLADAGSLERGAGYAADGRVHGLRHDGDLVVAEVIGTRRYRVRLWVDAGQLAHACTCPVGEEGRFCKHCVAVGLAWVNSRMPAARARPTLADLREHLSGLSRDALVELLMEQAAADERLRRRLLLEADRKAR
ncbi:MAG TPA: SWIM zinc finger family protein [Candidatus Eisenbacteria bacterium]|nr:SWIM zinc finger family protein [Candidatus Eisenbacteria bacterium]